MLTNFCLLRMRYTNRLMMGLMLEVSSYISKAFDKVWHEDIIFKLKQNDISGELLNLL